MTQKKFNFLATMVTCMTLTESNASYLERLDVAKPQHNRNNFRNLLGYSSYNAISSFPKLAFV